MTRRRRVSACGATMLFVAATCWAQAQSPYIDTQAGLSVDEAVARALEGEPGFRAARAEIEVARGMRVQAGLRPNPMTSFERREQPGGVDNQTSVGIEWPLDLFRRRTRVDAADREVDAAEHAVADRARTLASDVRLKYGQAAAAIRAFAIAGNLAESAQRDLTLGRARVAEGASPPIEEDLLDVEARRLESERLLAEGMVEAGMIELKRSLGMRPEAPLRLRDSIDALVARAGVPAAPPAGPRPDIREAEARVQLAEARINNARSEGRFDVSVSGSYMRMATGFPLRAFDALGSLAPIEGVFHYVVGGATVNLPIRNRNQGEIAVAQTERARAQARLEAARLAADAEIASAMVQEDRIRRALESIEGAVRLSRRNLDIRRQTYELGRATLADVLAEQRRYLEMEIAYTSTLRAAYEARVALLRARGDLQ